jgi:hypothetical protein
MMKQSIFWKNHQSYQCLSVEQFPMVKLLFLLGMRGEENIALFLTVARLDNMEQHNPFRDKDTRLRVSKWIYWFFPLTLMLNKQGIWKDLFEQKNKTWGDTREIFL